MNSKIAESIVDILLEGGAWKEYWLSPQPELIMAPLGHTAWAINNVLNDGEWQRDRNGEPVGVYAAMHRHGYVRVIFHDGNIVVDPMRCSRSQRSELEFQAIDRNMPIVDDKSGRVVFDPRSDS